jgi:hypothetical protein
MVLFAMVMVGLVFVWTPNITNTIAAGRGRTRRGPDHVFMDRAEPALHRPFAHQAAGAIPFGGAAGAANRIEQRLPRLAAKGEFLRPALAIKAVI